MHLFAKVMCTNFIVFGNNSKMPISQNFLFHFNYDVIMYHLCLFFVIIRLIDTSFAVSCSSQKPYVHGGENARIEEFPWVAWIRTKKTTVS